MHGLMFLHDVSALPMQISFHAHLHKHNTNIILKNLSGQTYYCHISKERSEHFTVYLFILTAIRPTSWEISAGIFKQLWELGSEYRPARLHRLAELIP